MLPREFEHSALKEAYQRGVEHGSLTAAEVRTACEQADVKPRRLKEVLGAMQAANITVTEVAARSVANAAPRRGTTMTIEKGEETTSATKTDRVGEEGRDGGSRPDEEEEEAGDVQTVGERQG